MPRSRPLYLLWITCTIAAGLFLRSSFSPLPHFFHKYGGDTLWALLIFWCCGLLFPKLALWKTILFSLLITYATETSQLYHAPWIDRLRENKIGLFLLGSVFHWPDFIAYTAGMGIGWALEWGLLKRPLTSPPIPRLPMQVHHRNHGEQSTALPMTEQDRIREMGNIPLAHPRLNFTRQKRSLGCIANGGAGGF